MLNIVQCWLEKDPTVLQVTTDPDFLGSFEEFVSSMKNICAASESEDDKALLVFFFLFLFFFF